MAGSRNNTASSKGKVPLKALQNRPNRADHAVLQGKERNLLGTSQSAAVASITAAVELHRRACFRAEACRAAEGTMPAREQYGSK